MSQETSSPGKTEVEALEEGELYVLRKGRLEHVPRNEDDGMRRIRITEQAYEAAMQIGRWMKADLGGYKPDVSLVVSALVLDRGEKVERTKEVIRQFVVTMFEQRSSDMTGG